MASSGSAPIGLRFGAELEVLTGSKANELSKELSGAQVKNHVNSDHNKDAEDYSEWSIIQEVTITNQMMQNKCKFLRFSDNRFPSYEVSQILPKRQGA